MNRSQLLARIAEQITRLESSHPIRVAIDGPDAAGKTTLAEELMTPLRALGRPVIRASIDGFHNPAHVRHARGRLSPDGYYRDSFNYSALVQSLLAPLGSNGSRCYRAAVFDYRNDSEVDVSSSRAELNAVLLFDGVFLLRAELAQHWDFTIFVDASFETALRRAERRDVAAFGNVEDVKRHYQERYIPGQELYFAECRPREQAHVVIDNNDPYDPLIL